jgi:hypothetical protein
MTYASVVDVNCAHLAHAFRYEHREGRRTAIIDMFIATQAHRALRLVAVMPPVLSHALDRLPQLPHSLWYDDLHVKDVTIIST